MSSAPDSDRLERRANLLVEDHDNFLQDLVRMRRAHKLTQKDVAERMGVSQPTVAAFEHYDSNPTLSTIQRYAMAVEAILNTTVIDDCGEGVPSEWSPRVERNVRIPRPVKVSQSVKFGELSYA